MTARPARPKQISLPGLVSLGAALLVSFASSAIAQPPAAAPVAKPASSAPVPYSAGRRNGSAKVAAGPTWRELSPSQQTALTPLAAQWDTLNEAQKRKWIALSSNYPKMSAEDQAKLHSRMTEWVSLSPQQRSAARLNYGETRKLSADDKKAKWEAYQALSPEEKKKLAAGAHKPPATAAAIRPVPNERLASVPRGKASASSKSPRIAAAPNQIDHNTLLPQQPHPQPPQPGTVN